jgi:hypothetical protein
MESLEPNLAKSRGHVFPQAPGMIHEPPGQGQEQRVQID